DGAVQLHGPVHGRLHQPDPAAGRVHLLVPQRVRRARREAEAAVDAVAEELRVHRATTPSGSNAARTRSASGGQARSTAPATNPMPGPGLASTQSCQAKGTRPPARCCSAAASAQTAESAWATPAHPAT